ncbi:MAG: AraC family transcriptional regulator [Pseudomonadota bacterium]
MSVTVEPNSYLRFYEETYGQYLIEKALVEGREMVGMFMTRQPAGAYPDAALEEYNLQMLMSKPAQGVFDIGEGTFETIIRQGDFLVVPSDTEASFELHDEHTVLGLGLPKRYFQTAQLDCGTPNFPIGSMLKSVHRDVVIQNLVQEMWKEGQTGGDLGALFIDSTILAITSRIVSIAVQKEHKERASGPLSDALFAMITDYVDSNVDTAIRMRTLANMAGANEYEFARQFKARTGLPPYQWVIERRIDKAIDLLSNTRLGLAEIAYAAGFSSQSHMNSLFKRKRGSTPLEYRADNR